MSDKKNNHASWDAYSMIENARSLQLVAKELEKNGNAAGQSDYRLFLGIGLAGPILLLLATEIALKAWQCSDRGRAPVQPHDLLRLFDLLNPDTQEMLEARMRKLSPHSVWAGDPRFQNLNADLQDMLAAKLHPLRDVLREHRDANMHWRYLYEKPSARSETNEIDRALTVIVDAFYERRRS